MRVSAALPRRQAVVPVALARCCARNRPCGVCSQAAATRVGVVSQEQPRTVLELVQALVLDSNCMGLVNSVGLSSTSTAVMFTADILATAAPQRQRRGAAQRGHSQSAASLCSPDVASQWAALSSRALSCQRDLLACGRQAQGCKPCPDFRLTVLQTVKCTMVASLGKLRQSTFLRLGFFCAEKWLSELSCNTLLLRVCSVQKDAGKMR